MSQQELADRVGVTPATIGNIERGRRAGSLRTRARIARVFGVSIDQITAAEERE